MIETKIPFDAATRMSMGIMLHYLFDVKESVERNIANGEMMNIPTQQEWVARGAQVIELIQMYLDEFPDRGKSLDHGIKFCHDMLDSLGQPRVDEKGNRIDLRDRYVNYKASLTKS